VQDLTGLTTKEVIIQTDLNTLLSCEAVLVGLLQFMELNQFNCVDYV